LKKGDNAVRIIDNRRIGDLENLQAIIGSINNLLPVLQGLQDWR